MWDLDKYLYPTIILQSWGKYETIYSSIRISWTAAVEDTAQWPQKLEKSYFATNNKSLSTPLSFPFQDYHKSIELIIDSPQNHGNGLKLQYEKPHQASFFKTKSHESMIKNSLCVIYMKCILHLNRFPCLLFFLQPHT